MRNIVHYYWTFILLLQGALIIRKIQNDGFYIWNIVALTCAIVFLFNRLKRNKVIVNAEVTMAFFIAINGVTTCIAQLMNMYSLPTLIVGLLVAIVSFFMTYFIWKKEK